MNVEKALLRNKTRRGSVARAVLNGIVGDHLVESQNPLAMEMGFYHRNVPLDLNNKQFPLAGLPLTNKVVVLLHGLTNLETVWNFKQSETECAVNDIADNYGLRLQRDFAYTPLFLRYNTGLSIEENGRQFSLLMNQLVSSYPIAIDDIILLGFSMGGLVSRYAQKIAIEENAVWLSKVSKCFYLGTPHEGARAEKLGHQISALVRSMPQDYINQWADWIDVRSEGIRDLKDGLNVQGSSTIGTSSSGFYPGAKHHFISGSLSEKKNSPLNKVLGDSLVTYSSANTSAAPKGSLFSHFEGVPHIPLAHSAEVYQQIKEWVASGACIESDHYEGLNLNALPEQKFNKLLLNNDDTKRKKDLLIGLLDLSADAYQKTVGAVESMHVSIAKKPHIMLQKNPLTRETSMVVEGLSKGVSTLTYRSVKWGGHLITVVSDFLKKTS